MALTTLPSHFVSLFSFVKPPFFPEPSSDRWCEEEPASLVDRKDIGERTAIVSFLQQDQISQPCDAFDFEKASEPSLFKVGSLKEHVDFWINSIRASELIINTIVEGCKFPFFDLPESFVIPKRCDTDRRP